MPVRKYGTIGAESHERVMPMKMLIIDNGTGILKKVETLTAEHNPRIISYDMFTKEEVASVDVVILTGSSIGPLHENTSHFQKEIACIQESQKPIIGLCMGLQLITYAFSNRYPVFLGEVKEGLQTITKLADDAIFDKRMSYAVYGSHRYAYMRDDLPDCLIPLATSEDGIEIVRHRDELIYGFQFHPEVTMGNNDGKTLFDRVLQKIAEK